jgi:hypothetical protein
MKMWIGCGHMCVDKMLTCVCARKGFLLYKGLFRVPYGCGIWVGWGVE